MKQASQLAQQFAQALANGELTLDDVGYVLEHVDGFIADYVSSDVSLWVNTNFKETASELFAAQRLAEVEA